MKQHRCKAHKNKLGIVWCSKCGKLFGKPWLFVLMLLFSSCASYTRCHEKYGEIQTIEIKEIVEIPVPEIEFQIDSIPVYLKDTVYTKGDSIIIEKTPKDTVQHFKGSNYDLDVKFFGGFISIENVKVKPDTIFNEVIVTADVDNWKPPENTIKDSIQWGVWLVIALIVLVVLVKFGFRR